MINVLNKLSWVVIHNEWRPEWEFVARSKGIQYRSEADEYFTTFWGNDQALLEQISREAIQMKQDNLWIENNPAEDTWLTETEAETVEIPDLYPVGSMVYIKSKKTYGRVVLISDDEPKLYGVDTGLMMTSGTYQEDDLLIPEHVEWYENHKNEQPVKVSKLTFALQTFGFALLTFIVSFYIWHHFIKFVELIGG